LLHAEVDLDMKHRTIKVSRARPAGVRKHPKHEVVFRKNLGNETMQAVFSRELSEPAQQRSTDTTKMFCVRHDNRHFGIAGVLGMQRN
jgi:hypothetical protein